MEQISIWDILSKEETVVQSDIGEVYKEQDPVQDCGRRCDCSLFSLNCYIKRGYVRVNGKWVRNEDGSIMIIGGECDWKPSEPWRRIEDDMRVIWWKGSLKEYTTNECEPECIDHRAKGAINEKPAWIGLGTYVSGMNEEYSELVPKYYKLTNDFTKEE